MSSSSQPLYVISVVAEMVGVEAHTLRYYEKTGLVHPQRSKGRVRLYSDDDVERLRVIKALINDMGVNLAGVDVALNLVQKIQEMQRQIEEREGQIEQLMSGLAEDVEWEEE
jgi:MerR family transcriptional regulator/heat shock protein HspR